MLLPMNSEGGHDVVVVGSGIAGPASAILLARQGMKVVLLEAHRDPGHYKRLCTHFMQSSALPVLQRLGVDHELDALGAVRNSGNLWTRYGWVREPTPADRPAYGFNVRRQVLDPLLREKARAAGVDVRMGAKVRSLLRDEAGRVRGVVARIDDQEQELTATVVVGADGKSSVVAEQAGLPAQTHENHRFGYFAHYRNVVVADGSPAQMWQRPPDVSYTFVNDDGVTLLATMPGKDRLADFEQDREAALLAMFEGLPAAPDLSRAERVSDVIGTKDYPLLTRKRVSAPGVALVGDAALVGDPLWGVGCGFALQGAGWLADALDGTDPRDRVAIDRALRSYGRTHRRRLRMHQALMADFASGRDFNPVERLVFGGGVHDEKVADAIFAYGTRNSSPMVLFSPATLARAARARRRHRVGTAG
jgi:flavin-dependent dehydrogenase